MAYTYGVAGFPDNLAQLIGFEWDEGNSGKNWKLHAVSRGEAEEIFFNCPIVVAPDAKHSEKEMRYAALGTTNAGRELALVFTIRGSLLRVISARDMSRRERSLHEQESKKP